MGIPDHLTCILRNLYEGQEATVRTGHGTHAHLHEVDHLLVYLHLLFEEPLGNTGIRLTVGERSDHSQGVYSHTDHI